MSSFFSSSLAATVAVSPFFEAAHEPKIDLESALHAMSLSPDQQCIAVAAKEVKILTSSNNRFSVDKNLRATGQSSRAVAEVKWHPSPLYSQYICSAPTNGKVILWNLQKDGSKRKENVMEDHFRSVNRLSWHPTEPCILTASMDGDVRLWDIKVPSHSSQTFPNSACCRDVAFNPFNNFVFAAAYEDGTIQFWDTRKGRKGRISTVNAHNGLILSIDWHPTTPGLLATGSRDKTIKVWDMNDAMQRPRHVVQTSRSVNRVLWRGARYPRQLASSAGLMDSSIHVWDVASPCVPLLQLVGHREKVTGFFWNGEQADNILSCSKDGTVRRQHVDDCVHPHKFIRTRGAAWGRTDELATFNDHVDRNIGPYVAPDTNSKESKRNGLVSIVSAPLNARKTRSSKTEHVGDADSFVVFAKQYKLIGKSLLEVCEWNAQIAQSLDHVEIAQVWLILGALFGDPQTTTSPAQPASQSSSGYHVSDELFDSFLPPVPTGLVQRPAADDVLGREFNLDVLDKLLTFASDRGDVQTCATVMVVLQQWGLLVPATIPVQPAETSADFGPVPAVEAGDDPTTKLFSGLRRQKLLFAYLQMLAQFELFGVSTALMNACKEDEMRTSNQKATGIAITCPHCGKASLDSLDRGVCDRCFKIMAHCAICESAVRGVFVWCQGCGHGGHLSHMQSWFSTNSFCPTGCQHVCTIPQLEQVVKQ